MSTRTLAINRLISQPGHNQHGYNPVNYQPHYHWARSHKLSMSQLGHYDPQHVYQRLLSGSKHYGVSIPTSYISSVYVSIGS